MVLMELQNAFDTINHEILLNEMYFVGFSAQSIAWFEPCLSNRRFQVNIKNEFSNVSYIN